MRLYSSIRVFLLVLCASLIGFTVFATASPASDAAPASDSAARAAQNDGAVKQTARSVSADTIEPGTRITMQNWQNYQQFMTDGMVALFKGQYNWKMPSDVEMEIGPTVIHPLPKTYLDATEKYSGQVKLIELPNGGLTLQNYQGGIPFPNPQEPHRAWKILANVWYRYEPSLAVDTYGNGCLIDSGGSINCVAAELVHRQLAFNTDPGIPRDLPGAEGKFLAQYLMVLEPEQKRYTASLTISYSDLARPEDVYAFIPQLRRYQPVSALARCSPSQGTDATQEDYRQGFDSNLTEIAATYVGRKKILAVIGYDAPAGKFPDGFDMPLGWPRPSWAKWQLRDVDVISVSKIPAKAAGYCYGKRVMYVDRATSSILWEELYDAQMRPWKFAAFFLQTVDAPGIGPVEDSGALIEAFWDIQHSHATFFIDPAQRRPFYVNEQAPKDYFDLTRYTEPAGLNLIMR